MISAETKGAYKIKQPVDFQPYISKETIATTAEINWICMGKTGLATESRMSGFPYKSL